MAAPDGTDPIADDEVLYRRIPVSQNWFDPQVDSQPSPQAFHPTSGDATGLSLYRAKYTTLEAAARGQRGKSYFVALLRAGDLRAHGIEVVPRPEPEQPGHAEIPGLTYENRKSDRSLEWKILLSRKLCLRIEGPFTS